MKKILLTSYFLFLTALSFFSYLFVDANFVTYKFLYSGFFIYNRELTAILYLIFICISFGFYGFFLFLEHKEKLSFKEVKTLILGSIIILFFAYPAMLSYDIFNYLLTDKLLFYHHENPYVVMPIEISSEPYLSFTRAANKLALYGPSWILVSGIPFLLFGYNTALFLFGMKLLVVCFYVWLVFLIWKLTKSTFAVVFFALNPLVLYEVLISGHNDVVMMALCFYAFLSLKEKKIFRSSIAMFFSIFVKYSVIVLLPVWLWVTILTVAKKKISWDKIYMTCSILLFCVFLLSPLREEVYPWYAVWFLSFVSLIIKKKWILYFCFLLSMGLMFRYIPYMYTWSYMGMTPLIREIFTFIPLIFFPLVYINHKKK